MTRKIGLILFAVMLAVMVFAVSSVAETELPPYNSREMTAEEIEAFFDEGNAEYEGDLIGDVYDALETPDEVFGMVYTAVEDYDTASTGPYANYIVDFELTSKTDVSVLLVGNYGSYGTIPVGVVNLKANTPINIMETASGIEGLEAWSRFTYADIVLLVNEFKCVAIPLTEDVLKAYNEVALTGEYDEEAVLADLLANANPLGEDEFAKAEEIVTLSLGLDLYETEMVDDRPVKTGTKYSVGEVVEFECIASLPEYDSREMTEAELEEFFNAGNTQYGGDLIDALYDALDNPNEAFGMIYTAKEDYDSAASGPFADYIVDFELTSKTDVSVLLVGNYGSYGTIPVGIVNLKANTPINVMETAATIPGLEAWAKFTYADIVLLVNEFKCAAIPLTENVLRAYHELAFTGEYDEEAVLADLLAKANPLGEESFAKTTTSAILSLGLDLYETVEEDGELVKTGEKFDIGEDVETTIYAIVPPVSSVHTTVEENDALVGDAATDNAEAVQNVYNKLDDKDASVYGVKYETVESDEAVSSAPYVDYDVDFEITSSKKVTALLMISYKTGAATYSLRSTDSYTTLPLGIVTLEENTPVRVLELAREIYPELSFTYADVAEMSEFNCVAMPLSNDMLHAYYKTLCEDDHDFAEANPTYNESNVLGALANDADLNPLQISELVVAEEGLTLGLDLNLYDADDNSWTAEDSEEHVHADVVRTTLMQKLLVINNMEAKDGYNRINVCAAIDTLAYSEVGFKVTVVDTTETYLTQTTSLATRTVYKKMTVENAEGTPTTYTSAQLGGEYMFGCELLLNATNYTNENTKIIITPYAIDLNGNEIVGKQVTLTDAAIKNKMPGSALFRN